MHAIVPSLSLAGEGGVSEAMECRLRARQAVLGIEQRSVNQDVVPDRAEQGDELHDHPDKLVLISDAPHGVAMQGRVEDSPRHRQKNEPLPVEHQEYKRATDDGRDDRRKEDDRHDQQDDSSLVRHATIVVPRPSDPLLREPPPALLAEPQTPRSRAHRSAHGRMSLGRQYQPTVSSPAGAGRRPAADSC